MKCSKCGKEVNITDNYCPYCKNKLNSIFTREITKTEGGNYLCLLSVSIIIMVVLFSIIGIPVIIKYGFILLILAYLIIIFTIILYPKNILSKILIMLYVLIPCIYIIWFIDSCGKGLSYGG